ncbi:MAG: 2-dehydro-3-deoxygalactonokinase [Sphingomonas sp.]
MPGTFIAGDWGTTHGRFWLIENGRIVGDERTAPGIAAFAGDSAAIAAAFDDAVAGWSPAIPAVLCGMAGASIGWRDAGYRACPAPIETLGDTTLRFTHRGRNIAILPGLKCRNIAGLVDVMRGEETQIAGVVELTGLQEAVISLPGTHNKWAIVTGGAVQHFHTALTGELFALLADHSILMRGAARDAVPGDPFRTAVCRVRDNPPIGIESMLFATRAEQLVGGLLADDAASFVSGLLIGADVRSALTMIATPPEVPVHLVCNEALAALYAAAIAEFGRTSVQLEGSSAVLAGLITAADQVFAVPSPNR